MALLRKLFYRKPPDGLLEISERVYVFDYCFSTDVWEEANYKDYIGGAISQLREHYPDAAILVFNFREGESASQIANALSEHDLTIMDYPRQYEGCPLLPMEVIHHFLRSSESWLSLGQQNVLLMHCERGGWPVLAFMLAALLIYRKHYSGEHKTLDMVYKQAPRELLHFLSPLNPIPSQLRYLQYVSRRNLISEWPPLDRALSLDCIIIRMIPKFDGEGGCRPIFRIYGQDPFHEADRTPKILFSTPKKSKAVRHYKQLECELVKIDINCHIQGDVVLECLSLNDDMEREQMMFRAMFNTAFIRSNILMLNRDEIDILWDAKDQFPKDFRAEVLFSEIDAATSVIPTDLTCFEEKDGLPVEAFGKVHEIFSSVDWLVMTASNVVQGKLATDAHQNRETSSWVKEKIVEKLMDRERYEALGRDDKSPKFSTLKDDSGSSPKSSLNANIFEQTAKSQHGETRRLLNGKHTPSRSPVSEPSSAVSSENSEIEASPFICSPSTSLSTPTIASPLSPKDPGLGFVKPQSPSLMPLTPTTPVMDKVANRSPPASPLHQRLPTSETESHGILTTDEPVSAPSSLLIHPTPATLKKNDNAKRIGSPPTNLIDNAASKTKPPSPLPPPPPPTTANATLPLKDDLDLKSEPSASLHPPATPLEENTAMSSGPPIHASPPTQPLKETSSFKGGEVPPHPPKEIEETSCSKGGSVSPPPPPLPPAKEIAISTGGTPPPPPPPPLRSGLSMLPTHSSVVPPAPPPPMQSGPAPVSSVAPPPPPPHMTSATARPTVPSAPPPPLLSKENPKAGVGLTHTSSGSPSPAPPSIPPPGGKGRALMPRTMTSKNNQSKKLKPLHWLKLTRAVQGSLWAETQKSGEASKTPEIDISELESLFSVAVPNSDQGGSGRKGSPRASLVQKPEKVQLIEHRRAYNCEIMLSKVKMPLSDLLSSMLVLEDTAMDVDQVEILIKFCPTKEEMELLKGYKGEKDKLGKCEQFFLELMQVPRIESKLRVYSFKIQFQSQVYELRNNLNIINSAADQIRDSAKLKRIMQTILSLGNALNQGTARGSAVGFRLDSLLKLTETRARNNKMTLMHYLCKVLTDKLPDLLDFSEDLSSLQPASKIQLKFLAEEMQAISKGLEKVVQELSMSENDGPVSENFHKALKEFLSFAEGEVRSLASLYSGVGRNVDALILYFGEDPSRCPFEQVTSTLLNFVRMFDKAHEENCKQLEFEKKKAEKEAAADKAEKMKMNASEEKAVKPEMHALQETAEKHKINASEEKAEKLKMRALEEKTQKLKKRALEEKAEKPKINASDRIMSI